jgi:hypothetical protein
MAALAESKRVALVESATRCHYSSIDSMKPISARAEFTEFSAPARKFLLGN